jgi:hypothetical protein
MTDPSGEDCFSQIVGNSLLTLGATLTALLSNLALLEAVAAGASLLLPGGIFLVSVVIALGAAVVLADLLSTCVSGT